MANDAIVPLIGYHIVQPNPVKEGRFTLLYGLKAAAERVTLRVFNGRRMEIGSYAGPALKGDNYLVLDSSGMADGLYSYSIEAVVGNLTELKKSYFIVFKDNRQAPGENQSCLLEEKK